LNLTILSVRRYAEKLLAESDLHEGFPVERGKRIASNVKFFAKIERETFRALRFDERRPRISEVLLQAATT
jgi:hypothetical protein